MVWALLLVIIVVTGIMTLRGKGQVPWCGKLRRLHPGSAYRGEWMAPEIVVNQVRSDYLAAASWLHSSALLERSRQWTMAPVYLDGSFLKRYQRVLMMNQSGDNTSVLGVLRADHQISVRHFSEDGERCLVIDTQLQRRMATYDGYTRERLHTQDLGECSQVYQMVYDTKSRRWKIETFIQELPGGWNTLSASQHIRVLSSLPTSTGRDN